MDIIREALEGGFRDGVYPGVVLLVGQGHEKVFFDSIGFRSLIPRKLPMEKDTVFDLASLTKPLATTLAVMKLVDQGNVGLDQPLSELLPFAPLRDKGALTPRRLLSHRAGLADWKPFYSNLVHFPPELRKAIVREQIIDLPFIAPPGAGCLYSDLGFILLEWVIQEQAQEDLPSFLKRHFFDLLSLKRTFLGSGHRPPNIREDRIAATEDCPWRKKVIQGEVHDENAYALGGYSGHAGLFGTAEEVYVLVRMLQEHYLSERNDFFEPETVKTFFTRQQPDGENTWALGWDTPSPENSSAGRYFSRNSVGHLGFTGTSVWMDLEKDVIAVLLTNRIHPTRENEKIRAFRPRIHDKAMKTLGLD